MRGRAKINTEKIGKFKVTSGEVIVSDPCYDKPHGNTKYPINGKLKAKNGTWRAKVVVSDEGNWGDRVAYLVCNHVDHPLKHDSSDLIKVDFQVCVDSGQAGVFDAANFKDDASAEGLERYYDKPAICVDEPWYSICCDRTLNDDGPGAGVIPQGAVSSSGYGDGSYECSVVKDGKEVVGIVIDFGLEDEDEDEDCDIDGIPYDDKD